MRNKGILDMMFLDLAASSQNARNTKHEIFINSLLDVPAELRAFCRMNGIKFYPDMMQYRFVGLRQDLEDMIRTHIKPNSEFSQNQLISQISLTV